MVEKKPPNIVIVNPDHFRAEALAHLGNPAAVTPNLDETARTGVSFRYAFCQNPVCSPSRCSFMSGWYPHVRGHRTMHHLMRGGEPVLLRILKENGYYVWWGGKNDLVAGQHGMAPYCHAYYPGRGRKGRPVRGDSPWRGEPGGDNYFSFYMGELDKGDEEYYPDEDWDVVHRAIEVIEDPPAEPFCLFLALSYPHPPFAVEEPWFSLVDRNALPPRAPLPEDWDMKPAMLRGICRNRGLEGWDEARWNELRAVYYGMCSRVDHQYGLILDALKRAGRWDETAVFFFSDHGVYAGDFCVVDINQNTFEDVQIRVPFLVKPPSSVPVRPGIRDALVELVDFPATVYDLAGIEPGYSHFGMSLLPLVRGERNEHRDAVFCEGGRLHGERHCMELEYEPGHTDPTDIYYPRLSLQASDGPEHTKAVMCRTREYKYVMRLYEKDEFYDLRDDPRELHNRIDVPAYEAAVSALRERLLRFFLETCDVVPHDPDERSAAPFPPGGEGER